MKVQVERIENQNEPKHRKTHSKRSTYIIRCALNICSAVDSRVFAHELFDTRNKDNDSTLLSNGSQRYGTF